MKTCSKCKIEYKLSEFYKFKRSGKKKREVFSWCKLCSIAAVKESQEFKPEYYKAWLEKHLAKPEVQARRLAYGRSEKRLAAQREAYKFNRADPAYVESVREYDRKRWAEKTADPQWLANRNKKRRELYARKKAARCSLGTSADVLPVSKVSID